MIHLSTSPALPEAQVYVWRFLQMHYLEEEIDWNWNGPAGVLTITVTGHDDSWIRKDVFFDRLSHHWLDSRFSIPLNRNGVFDDATGECNDLATIFYLLSHYGECLLATRDVHGRVPAKDTWVFQQGAHLDPLVNHAAERFVTELARRFPSLHLKSPTRAFRVTHDVDRPFYFGNTSWWTDLKKPLRGLLSRPFELPSYTAFLKAAIHPLCGDLVDPWFTFPEILTTNKEHGSVPYFYWIPLSEDGQLDALYHLDSPRMRRLFSLVHTGGGVSGVHPNYHSSENSCSLCNQTRLWKDWLSHRCVRDTGMSRQHYLRFDPLHFPAQLMEAGIQEDSSYGFAETIGWRASCTLPYQLFDLKTQQATSVLEVPLVAMDVSIFTDKYMNRPAPAEVLNAFLYLLPVVERHGGVYCILWHNDSLSRPGYKDVYDTVVGTLAQRLKK